VAHYGIITSSPRLDAVLTFVDDSTPDAADNWAVGEVRGWLRFVQAQLQAKRVMMMMTVTGTGSARPSNPQGAQRLMGFMLMPGYVHGPWRAAGQAASDQQG
jgi:hypothetical protein